MATEIQKISLRELSNSLKEAREKKGWTLEQLSHELWQRGFPTSQNKLWRMENKPPKRVDTELVLWLERLLDVELMDPTRTRQVLIDDVLELLDGFILAADSDASPPPRPANRSLASVHDRLEGLLDKS